jgi:hypothetical protein
MRDTLPKHKEMIIILTDQRDQIGLTDHLDRITLTGLIILTGHLGPIIQTDLIGLIIQTDLITLTDRITPDHVENHRELVVMMVEQEKDVQELASVYNRNHVAKVEVMAATGAGGVIRTLVIVHLLKVEKLLERKSRLNRLNIKKMLIRTLQFA